MTLQSQIQKIVDDTVNRFIANVANKLNVPSSSIEEIWNESQAAGSSPVVTSNSSSPKRSSPTMSEQPNKDLAKLQKMKKDELKDLCKDLPGYTARLTKIQLIELHTKGTTAPTNKPVAQTNKPPTKKLGLLDTSFLSVSPWKSDDILIHEQTGILLDKKTSKAIGSVDSATGNRKELSVEDYDICKKYKIPYDVKGNLDAGNNAMSQVDELESDDESDEEELVEEELIDEESDEFEMEENEI